MLRLSEGAEDEMAKTFLVVGIGAAGRWSNNASALEKRDADFWKQADELLDELHAAGGCTSPRAKTFELGSGWILVAKADEEDFDADPAVVAYREVEIASSPNAIRPQPELLTSAVLALDAGDRAEAAEVLRVLGETYPERTEWPYLAFSATADTPANHARWVERRGTPDEMRDLARNYRAYRWDVAS